MKLVVGLGNPGTKYEHTRHNIGFIFLDLLAEKLNMHYKISKLASAQYAWTEVLGEKIGFLKPITFMNNSGVAVAHAKKNHPDMAIEDILVIHDDLDLRLGEYKLQLGVGPKEHNGINDIEERLKSKNFWRVRVGIDNRNLDSRIPGEEYVLQKFNNEELELLKVNVFSKISEELLNLLHHGR